MNKSLKLSVLLHSSVAITLLIVLNACSSGPNVEVPEEIAGLENLTVYSVDTEPDFALHFTDSLIIGDDEDVMFSGRITASVNENGEIFVTDYGQRTVFHFSQDGELIKQFGREGSGPGEFTGIQYPQVKNGNYFAYDYGPARLNVFDTNSGELIRDFTVQYEDENEPGTWRLSGLHASSDRNLLALMKRSVNPDGADSQLDNRIMLMSPEGEILEKDLITIEEPPSIPFGGQVAVRPSYMASLTVRFGEDGGVIFGTNNRLLLNSYDPSGQHIKSIYYNLEGEPVTSGDIRESTEGLPPQFSQLIEQADLPDRWPVWSTFHVDDRSRIWVSLNSADRESEQRTWWILDNTGQKLAEKVLPSHLSVAEVRGDLLYASTLDEMGRRVIARYKFELN